MVSILGAEPHRRWKSDDDHCWGWLLMRKVLADKTVEILDNSTNSRKPPAWQHWSLSRVSENKSANERTIDISVRGPPSDAYGDLSSRGTERLSKDLICPATGGVRMCSPLGCRGIAKEHLQ